MKDQYRIKRGTIELDTRSTYILSAGSVPQGARYWIRKKTKTIELGECQSYRAFRGG
jgi:hypothetical protein